MSATRTRVLSFILTAKGCYNIKSLPLISDNFFNGASGDEEAALNLAGSLNPQRGPNALRQAALRWCWLVPRTAPDPHVMEEQFQSHAISLFNTALQVG